METKEPVKLGMEDRLYLWEILKMTWLELER